MLLLYHCPNFVWLTLFIGKYQLAVGGALIREEHLEVSLTLVKFCNMMVPLFILACLFLQGSVFPLEAVVRCFHITIHYHSELLYCLLNPV
jgi:ethanolamine transporter EutH